MRFEAVRLIHAQGVPNHYVANQVYIPGDEDHQKRGSFIILIDQANTKDGSLVASLINTLIREYYRQSGHDPITDFEQTLIRLNGQLTHLAQDPQMAAVEINGSIVLCTDTEIHLSHIGQPQAVLWRDNNLITLVDKELNAEEAGSSFSVITSGEVRTGDVLALITPVENEDQVKPDLTFAFQQVPLYESGRGYARILRQRLERNVETIFIAFGEAEGSSQIYVDKALESMSERMSVYQKHAGRHASFVLGGAQFLFDKTKNVKSKKKVSQEVPKDTPIFNDESSEASEPPQDETKLEQLLDSDEAKVSDYTQPSDEVSPEKDAPYQVKSYWQTDESLAPPLKESKKEKLTEELFDDSGDVTTTEHHVFPAASRIKVKPRTIYVLVGLIILLILAIRVVNGISPKSPASDTSKQSAQERDKLIADAETNEQEAEKAQASDDASKALELYMTAITNLKKITDERQNEKSKSLIARAEQAIKSLSKTTDLPDGTQIQQIANQGSLLVATPSGTFVIDQKGKSYKYTGDAVNEITAFPPNLSVISGTIGNNGKSVAWLTKDQQVYLVDTSTSEVKQLTRADGQPWPQAKHITNFDQNLYFVADTMSKATPNGDKYNVTPYNKQVPTSDITSIVNNAFFYAIEGARQLERIDSKSAKNPISFSGVPDSFFPETITRIVNSASDNILYLFDADGQRLIEITTDGVYHKQWVLPKNEQAVTCDVTGTSLICTNKNKQIKTFNLAE